LGVVAIVANVLAKAARVALEPPPVADEDDDEDEDADGSDEITTVRYSVGDCNATRNAECNAASAVR
jgi:hypothetical protein